MAWKWDQNWECIFSSQGGGTWEIRLPVFLNHFFQSRYPRAYAAWNLKLKLNVPFVHSFLMVHVLPTHLTSVLFNPTVEENPLEHHSLPRHASPMLVILRGLMGQRIPRLRRGALSPTGSRHVVLRASFDRIILGQHKLRRHPPSMVGWWGLSP